MRLFIGLLLIAICGQTFACDKPSAPASAEDVVFNRVSVETIEIDSKLQEHYKCKYAFAMIFGDDGYEPMRLISGSQPDSPKAADGQKISGRVLVGFILNVDGIPVDPVVVDSPNETLSLLAKEHVLTLRYKASKYNGRSVRALGVQVYDFR